MQLDNASLHYAIIKHFLDRQHAPSIDDLAVQFGQPREAVIAGLQALQEYHGVVLHPVSSQIWAIHPFSSAPCSTMLLFDSEAQIDDWCERHRIRKGNVQPLSRVVEFAKVWYGRHADPAWRKWSSEEAKAIFERFGFIGPIWDIPTNAARF